MMACCLVALGKAPSFSPVRIGYIISRILSKCVLLVTGATATEAYGNLNLCSGLGSRGIYTFHPGQLQQGRMPTGGKPGPPGWGSSQGEEYDRFMAGVGGG